MALPEFEALPAGRKAALLDALCSLNPNIQRRVVKSGGRKVDGVRQKTTQAVTHEVAKGQPILVPTLKDLDRLARQERNEEPTPNRTITGS